MLGFHVAGLIHWEKVTCCRAGMHGCTLSRKLLSRPCYTLLNFFLLQEYENINLCSMDSFETLALPCWFYLLNSMVNNLKSDKLSKPGIIIRNKKRDVVAMLLDKKISCLPPTAPTPKLWRWISVSQLLLLHKNTKMVYVTFHCQSKLGIKPMNFRWTLMETQISDQGTVHGVENRYQHIVK